MPNLDRPRGAEPKGACVRSNAYVSGGAVFPGDFVSLDSSGRVVAASATAALVGVAMSYASGAGQDVIVADHPDQLFIVQADDGTVDAQTDIGLNYDILATAGNAVYRTSRMELDASTQATTATLPLKLLGIEKRPDSALGAFVSCVVAINNHQLKGSTGTAGV